MLPQTGDRWVEAPLLGVADAFEQAWMREPAKYLVAISALVILVAAAQAAMLGLSRLGYALSVNRQIPSRFGSLHPTRATPVGIIVFGAVTAICLLIPADLEFLAADLRVRRDDRVHDRRRVGRSACATRSPTATGRTGCRSTCRSAAARCRSPRCCACCMSAIAFVALLVEHGSARWVGVVWMVAGVSLYVGYRTSQGKSVLKRVTVPESALTRRAAEAEFGSMLVPVLGTPLDDDIMQTAGRLAAEENADDGEGGAMIEALWIFEVPMALPLDTRIPDAELKRARAALKRAKAVGEEYQGVEVATAVVRARRAGQAIVHEAKRRGVEAIVLAAEEPTRVGGGLRLRRQAGPARHERGGDDPLRRQQGALPRDPDRAARGGGARTSSARSRRTRRCRSVTPSARPIARVQAVFVLVVGAGRVGAALATSALGRGHIVSVLDEDPLSHERLDVELGRSWEEAGGRFTIGTALEVDALIEAGVEEADVFIASTNGDNTNLVVAQIAQRRFEVERVIARVLDPRRAAWYSEQGLQTICPTQIAIEQLQEAALGQAS